MKLKKQKREKIFLKLSIINELDDDKINFIMKL